MDMIYRITLCNFNVGKLIMNMQIVLTKVHVSPLALWPRLPSVCGHLRMASRVLRPADLEGKIMALPSLNSRRA